MRNNISEYSFLDRAVHKLAFSSRALQSILADLENLYAKQWTSIEIKKPIFITSLPRAGTTVILQALSRMPHVATHTYRDMPFVLTPLIWNKFSRGLRRPAVSRERSHSDGLEINEDSPEAFEEVLWKKYFPENYRNDNIALWGAGSNAFEAAFRTHIKKILLLRAGEEANQARYTSKNNANIARVGVVTAIFPDAKILVPLRNPLEHAISMLRQHENFADQHNSDVFSQRYMVDIGHYEFGSLHRPLKFPGLDRGIENLQPGAIDYWLAYWIAVFEALQHSGSIEFVRYEELVRRSDEHFAKICEFLQIRATTSQIQVAAGVFRGAPPARAEQYLINPALKDRAMSIYSQLCQRCILRVPNRRPVLPSYSEYSAPPGSCA